MVGSRDAKEWYNKGDKQANFRKLKKFAKIPALSACLNSIVNLGFFVTEQDLPDTDEQTEGREVTFEDIQLSELGLDLAKRYNSAVDTLSATRQLASKDRLCSISGLSEFGRHGGLCELTNGTSNDRDLLRDIFFAEPEFLAFVEKSGHKKESHVVRRKSLLLILETCQQLSAGDWILNELGFAGAVYFGEIANDKDRLNVRLPAKLTDIATRWRMFYFHHYMAVALEGLFSWLVSQLRNCGLAGATLESLVTRLDEAAVRKNLSEALRIDVKGSFGTSSPSSLFTALGLKGDLSADVSMALDDAVRSMNPFAEDTLENLLRSKEHLYSSTGLALPLILLATTLARYTHWETTKYGNWLAGVADPQYGHDPYLDLVPPILMTGLSRRFGKWWNCTWKELAGFVLSRYVVQQHQSMSYEKSWAGDRCLLQVDGHKVFSTGGFDKIGMGNPRLSSATQILIDIGLLDDDEKGVIRLTTEGKHFLKRELAKEIVNEVS
ncbi:MAG: hypothetical protein HYY46_02270 [Deltaproteobacteria bacterium]|nr:hypothetical protein [Deltaproteobacteria bacterium]